MEVEEIRKAVEEAGRRHYAAASAGDTEALSELLADELIYSHSNGVNTPKAEYLQMVADGHYVTMGMTVDHSVESLVVLSDDVVVVRGKQISNTTGAEGRFKMDDTQASSLDVWVNRDGRWQLVGHHMTLVLDGAAWGRAFAASH
jgi:hypothetical protein